GVNDPGMRNVRSAIRATSGRSNAGGSAWSGSAAPRSPSGRWASAFIFAEPIVPRPPGDALCLTGPERGRSLDPAPSTTRSFAVSVFTEQEIEYLGSHTLGRLATVGPDGRPHLTTVPYHLK